MNYLTNLFGPNAPLAATFIVAFAVVLVLIGLMAWVFRLVRGRGLGLGVGSRGRQPRLAVLDYADVDQRRKLVLIRRDNVEHLLLLGGPTDVVVETAIVRGVPVQASALREPTSPAAPEMPIQPPVQEPAPRLSMRETARQAAGEPVPAVRPVNLDSQPVPRAEPRPDPLRAPPRPPAAPPRPEPARPEPVRAEPPARPEPPVRSEPPRIEPPRVEPVRPEPPKVAPVVTPPPRPVAPPPPPPRPAPATDDVAARLEAALRKPIGATPPARPAEPRPVAPPRPAAPPPANGGKTLSADEKSVFDSLEEEMAALLGRGPTPPKS